MMENMKEISEMLKVLANENRLLIVCHLINEEMTVSELHEKMIHISQPALSQHLAMLKANKIVDSTKSGLSITYFMKDERIERIIEVLKTNYCK